ncbi:MAG: peptidase family protein [Actinomycetia bacterium]|nr:peptidase family protein [Actinomycetes bacterium]
MMVAAWAAMAALGLWAVTSDAHPSHPVAAPVTTTLAPTTTTTLPPTTTTTAAPDLRPVDVPTEHYAPEPIAVIGTIEIPKLGLHSSLGEGISLVNIDRNPSHWPGTAMPGQPGNVVVAGHRVTHTKPFRHIDELVPGDEVFFTVGPARYRYVVTGSQVVTPSHTEIVDQTPDATGTLFACHPPGSARYRYVVHLKLA